MRLIKILASVLISAHCLPSYAQTPPVSDLAWRFGALESIQHIAMSPDGNWLSLIRPTSRGGQVLFVVDLVSGGEPKPIIKETDKGEEFSYCRWATNERLICNLSVVREDGKTLISFSRLFAINRDGKGAVPLTQTGGERSIGLQQTGGWVIDWDVAGKPGAVLMTRQFLPQITTGTTIKQASEGLGVEEVDTVNSARKLAERPKPDAINYLSDGRGNVRVMLSRPTDSDGFLGSKLIYYFRKAGSKTWERLSVVSSNAVGQSSGMDVEAVDPVKDLAYGFDDNNGFQALFSLTLDGHATRQVLLSRPDVDVDSLVRIGRDRRVVGASYASEKRVVEYFDPELKRLSAALGRALPGKPNVNFIDSSQDESKLLLFASGDTDPGSFYSYDKKFRKLEEILPIRPELDGVAMAPMTPVKFPAADGTQIPGYLTLPPGSAGKNLPAIVMPHGGPGSRDEWGFDWLVQYFAVRGFAVLQPNFRGSTGYGSSWYQRNGFQSWKTAIGDVNDAGRWLKSQGIVAPGKLGILGWSYGGFAALQTSVLDPDLFKAIVAVAPVTDLDLLRNEAAEFTNAKLVEKFVGTGPHIKEGSPAQNAGKIKAPVLMFHGDKDQNVGVNESRLMHSKLKDAGKRVEYVEFPGLDHYLEDPAARARLLSQSDAFLRKELGL